MLSGIIAGKYSDQSLQLCPKENGSCADPPMYGSAMTLVGVIGLAFNKGPPYMTEDQFPIRVSKFEAYIGVSIGKLYKV